MLALLLVTALAQESVLVFRTSPGARVESLPTVDPDMFELAVYENRVNIHEQIPISARHIKDIESVSVGAGTSYVRFHTDRSDLELTAEKVPEGLRLVFVPGEEREPEVTFEPAPYEVITGENPPVRRIAALPDVPILPFTSSARTYRWDPWTIPMGIEGWTGGEDELLPEELQSPPASWEAADGYRAVLTGAGSNTDRRMARLLLAETYLSKGIPHEAAYYLDDVVDRTGPWHPSLPHLLMAKAQVGKGDYDEAAEHCRAAAGERGPELTVLRCLGVVALQTGRPAPRHIALAIEERATDGRSLLLAAELMLADNDYEAAHRIATAAVSDLRGREKGRGFLALGDAAYFTGQREPAKEAWTVAARYGFPHLVRTRRLMAQLAEEPRRTWQRHVPYLERVARWGGEAGVEAHYLLGQIAESFPDPETAARHYHAVWDASPQTAMASDIPERLVGMCTRYVDHLEEGERWTDLAIFSSTCWRPDLDLLAADTALSESWAKAYTELGLVDEALKVQRRVVRVRNELDTEEVGPLIDLAALYTRSGRPREALETVEYVRERLKRPASDDPRLLLRSAEAYAALGETKPARALWTSALGSEVTRDRARRALGLLDAYEGRCTSALRRLTEEDAPQQLALARCALDLGRSADAERHAADVVVNRSDAFLGEGAWLLGAAAFAQRRPELVDEAEGPAALWAALLAEEAEDEAFREQLERRLP